MFSFCERDVSKELSYGVSIEVSKRTIIWRVGMKDWMLVAACLLGSSVQSAEIELEKGQRTLLSREQMAALKRLEIPSESSAPQPSAVEFHSAIKAAHGEDGCKLIAEAFDMLREMDAKAEFEIFHTESERARRSFVMLYHVAELLSSNVSEKICAAGVVKKYSKTLLPVVPDPERPFLLLRGRTMLEIVSQ